MKRGEPCKHVGCLNHISHPCEGCGRIGGRKLLEIISNDELLELIAKAKGYKPEQLFTCLENDQFFIEVLEE